VATLDDDPGLVPNLRIWTSHDVPWLLDAGHQPRYPQWQPGH
jgi:ADP-ribosyl-[dinitrogen reductase] hydrolase